MNSIKSPFPILSILDNGFDIIAAQKHTSLPRADLYIFIVALEEYKRLKHNTPVILRCIQT